MMSKITQLLRATIVVIFGSLIGAGVFLASPSHPTSRPMSPPPPSPTTATKDLELEYVDAGIASELYSMELNPSASLTQDDLDKLEHERLVRIGHIELPGRAHEDAREYDLGAAPRIVKFYGDRANARIFLQEYVERAYYTYRTVDLTTGKLTTPLAIRSQEPDMPLLVGSGGRRVFVSAAEEGGGRRWTTHIFNTTNFEMPTSTAEYLIGRSSTGANVSRISADGRTLYAYGVSAGPLRPDRVDTLVLVDAETGAVKNRVSLRAIGTRSMVVRGIFGETALVTLQRGSWRAGHAPVAVAVDLRTGTVRAELEIPADPASYVFLDGVRDRVIVDDRVVTAEGRVIRSGKVLVLDWNGAVAEFNGPAGGRLLAFEPSRALLFVEHGSAVTQMALAP